VVNFKPVQLLEDRIIPAGVCYFAARAAAGPATEMHSDFDAGDPFDDLVDHVDGEVGCLFCVGIFRAHIRIDEQAQMRVIDLNDIGSLLLQQFELAAQHRHACTHKVVLLRVRLDRLFTIPHAFSQQRRRRKCGLDLPFSDCL